MKREREMKSEKFYTIQISRISQQHFPFSDL